MFTNSTIDFSILRERAFNLRWAMVPEGVIPLTAADPDFPCAPRIAEAISEFATTRYFSYGPPEGSKKFRESVARWFGTYRSLKVQPSQVMAVDSAAFGIYNICKAFLKPGDEAIIFDPVDFLFRYSIENIGATAVPFAIPADTRKPDFDHLQKLITKKTKMLCLCNPLNPTGKVFTKDELKIIGDLCVKNDVLILSDEIWSDIVFSPHTYTSIGSISDEIYAKTITVTGFSKSYGLAGLRIGALIAPSQKHFDILFEASLHGSTVHGANILSQVAACTALDECQEWLRDFVKHLAAMRDLTVNGLNEVKGFKCVSPEGCYVAFADIRGTGKSSSEIQELLLNKAKVAVVPGLKKWFGDGAEGYIRLSFATSSDVINEAIMRIKNTIN
jgi:aminotransferase